MPSIQEKKMLFERGCSDLYGGGEPLGESRVLGTDVEIGGVSPVLEP